MRLPKPSKGLRGAQAVLPALGMLLSAGCGSLAPNFPFGASATSAGLPQGPASQAPATGTVAPATPAVTTPTAGEFALNLTPLPTQTALPMLVLPTESSLAGAFEVWDGLPTYLADSQPGFYFRVRYDPTSWAITVDAYGAPALAQRVISGCVITPAGGRGLPLNGTVDHEVRRVGAISFQVNTAYVNGVRQFVNYIGGNGVIYTGFQVTFTEPGDQCLTEAETVLGSLTAVAISEATPIPRP